jgi:hypothetical protein
MKVFLSCFILIVLFLSQQGFGKTFYCKDLQSLQVALAKASTNDSIRLNKGLKVKLDGLTLNVNQGVFVFGEVGITDKHCPILFKTTADGKPMIQCLGSSISFQNLILSGPDSVVNEEFYKKVAKSNKSEYYKIKPSKGIYSTFGNIIITRCELRFFSHAAIAFYNFTPNQATPNMVKDCFIHHNYRPGLGYGIANDNSACVVLGNLFDSNRHAIQGTGKPLTSYFAMNNLIAPQQYGHAFDMHGGFDRKDNTNIAGNSIFIFGNITLNKSFPFVKVRGIPQAACLIYGNYLMKLRKNMEIMQLHAKGRMVWFNNLFLI